MPCRPPQFLPPPYRQFVPYDPGTPPPIGSITILSGMIHEGELDEVLREAARVVPWTAMVILVPPHDRVRYESIIPALRSTLRGVVGFVRPEILQAPTPAEVIAGVLRRYPPTGEELGRWASHRLERPDLIDVLGSATGHGLPLVYPVRPQVVGKRLRENGLPPREHWTWLANLARARRERDWPGTDAAGALATEWLRRVADCSPRTARQRPGWEWIMERGLRRWAARMTGAGRREFEAEVWNPRLGEWDPPFDELPPRRPFPGLP